MYYLYCLLPDDICYIIRNILLSYFIDNKINLYTYNFYYITTKYNKYFYKYSNQTIFNISNIFSDIDYIYKNILIIYNKYLNKYNICDLLNQLHYQKLYNVNILLSQIKQKLNKEQYIVNRYSNILSITNKKIDIVLQYTKDIHYQENTVVNAALFHIS